MELSDYIRVVRKNWLVFVATALLGVLVAAGYSLTRTPVYEAQSTVFVSTQTGGSVQELQQGSNFSQARVLTYVPLVRTPIVLNPVITELGLTTTADQLAASVTASSEPNSALVDITVKNTDPIKAAAIANGVGASLAAAVERIETPDGDDRSPVRLTPVRDALPPFTPVSPSLTRDIAAGGLIGLFAGVVFAAIRSLLDNKVRNQRQIESLTDRPLIGAIPFDPKAKERPLILHEDPHNPRSEAFRSLRTNLQFLEVQGNHTFVVTSSLASEGKSTTTINLAVALADAGKRVALVDADLRKPKVASYLNIEGGAGLTDVLIGRAAIADVMLPWGDRSLFVLPSGRIPPNPSELLGSMQMSELIEALSEEFDVVLFDAPPLLPVTDAAILSRSTTGAIVIVAAGRTTTHQVSGALDALKTVGARVAGMALTMVPTRGPDAYGYGYGYGGYGQDDSTDPAVDAVPSASTARPTDRVRRSGRRKRPVDDPARLGS